MAFIEHFVYDKFGGVKMLELMNSLGLGIATNLLSDSLVRKLEAFKDKKAVESFIQNLSDWEIEFEKQNDGTIATSGEFYSYIKYHNVVENIVTYFLEPSTEALPENIFLNDFHTKIVRSLEEATAKDLSWSDSNLIRNFLTHLIATTKTFLFERISLEECGLFYLICQSNAKIDHMEQTIKEKFQIQDQKIQHILERLSAIQKVETEDIIKTKVISWNSRQINNLGNRYTPNLNIPLKIMDCLHGASIDQQFQNVFYDEVDSFLIAMRGSNFNELDVCCDAVEKIVTELNFFNITSSDIEVIISSVNAIETFLTAKIEKYNKEKKNYDSKAYQLFEKLGFVSIFKDYLTDTAVKAAVSPYIIMVGDGGVGKSHLIADYIEDCNSSGNTSLLLLGQQFSAATDLLASLPCLFGCDITYYELFAALESIARAQQRRVLICIDALNEGAGVGFWNNALGGLVDFLKDYPHIGLLVSVRTQYEDALFSGQDMLKGKMQRIEHLGFATIEHDAMHQYFSFYGITIDSVVFPITEFRNPLFLRLFCIANTNKHISLGDISLPSVYSQYIDVMEQRVSERCGYHKTYKLISKIIYGMVSKRIDEHRGAVTLSLDDTLALIVDICKRWNVSADVYGALLTEGVLTQSITYDGSEYVYITYERLEDYFLAEKIVSAYSMLNEDRFFEEYSWIVNRPDLLQFFGIILAEKWEFELFDVFPSDKMRDTSHIRNAFLYGLLWRNANSITTHTREYINSEILQHRHSFIQFVDVLFALSARPRHKLNAKNTFSYFQGYKMPDRDAVFISVFDELYDNHNSALYRIIEWGLVHASKQAVTDDVAESCATILSWLLISPNNEIRDKSTKAIICILNSHMAALLSLMQTFEEIDDPYISERLYGIAFGCVVNEDSSQQVKALAEYVYRNIFDNGVVYPNILLRTYAKNIIDYASHIGCVEDGYFDAEKITPPYNTRFPAVPSDEEIKTYKLDYNSESFEDHHWSQLAILNSMRVEYSRSGQPGGYGDFGRYIFQSYFNAWRQLHPIDLKNIAIKRIFDLGYDVEKHGKYDRNCTNHVSIGTQHRRKERIGKKYQWIAFYELAAQVCDNFTMTVYDNDIGEPHQEYCKGSFEPDIRNIDPTVFVTSNIIKPHIYCEAFSYVVPNNSYEEWLSDFTDVPSFEQCIKLQCENQLYLLLTGEYDWKEAKRLGFRSYDLPHKDMWHQIRGYVVKNEHVSSLIHSLAGVDFMGRWMPEAQINSSMYNKECCWSDAHDFFKNPYYCGSEWVNIDSYYLNCAFQEKVLIPVKQYFSERKGELNTLNPETPSIYWYKPCEEINKKLKLKYLKGSNSVFVDSMGELVCFDSSELLGNDTGFYIRYDKLLEFVEISGYTLIWTSLSQKQLLKPSFGKWDLPQKAIHMSSVYYLKDGKIIKASDAVFEVKLYR